jgi:uncharacterized damage-inducible protein DinB
MIARPQTGEYSSFYAGYVGRVPEGGDLFALLRGQPDDLRALLGGLSDEQANARPAPGEWSVKEVMGHICDAERVFAYRALRIARGDTTPLPAFEQNEYVKATDFNARRLADLLEEFTLQRRANLLCFQPLTGEELARWGTSSGNPVTARALLHIMAGHVLHHIESLQVDYKVGAAG